MLLGLPLLQGQPGPQEGQHLCNPIPVLWPKVSLSSPQTRSTGQKPWQMTPD